MARLKRVSGERPLFWVGSSKEDLVAFPHPVQDEIATALSVAHFGGKHPKAKPRKGEGAGIFEIVEHHRGDTYRRFTRSDSKVSFTFFTRSRRNHRVAYGLRRKT